MIKNVIFDIGGVLFDNKNNSLESKFGISKGEVEKITQIAFGDNFKNCMLGNTTVQEYSREIVKRYPDIKKELEYVLDPIFYNETFPLKTDVYKIALDLYQKGYHLYILSNNTEASFNYVSQTIDLSIFKGIVCSYKEHLAKPDTAIFQLILDRYQLKYEETILIDDKEKNINAANNIGIKTIKFNNIRDIIDLIF